MGTHVDAGKPRRSLCGGGVRYLVGGQGEDAREAVLLRAELLFGEVAHHVTEALRVALHHEIKQKQLHVKVQRLVVQEELRQQAQILRAVARDKG